MSDEQKYESRAVTDMDAMEVAALAAIADKRDEMKKEMEQALLMARAVIYTLAERRGWKGAKNFRMEGKVPVFDVLVEDAEEE